MKTTIWLKKKMTLYIGGDPKDNKAPVITLELKNPQLSFDSDGNIMVLLETN